MKVLLINGVCGIRSTGRICTDLAAVLEKEGHEVKIAYGRESVPEPFGRYAVRIGTDRDVRLHGVRARLFDGAGFGSRAATEKFIAWVKEYDPDVIHLHNIHGYYLHIGVLFSYLKTCGKKIIWTLHDSWAFTGHTAYCDFAHCEKWRGGCVRCPLIKEYPRSLVDFAGRNWKRKKQIFSGVPDMTVVTPSEWLAGLVRQSFLSGYQVKVIRNGIDTGVFRPVAGSFRKRFGLEGKRILLGVSTVWDNMKGYADFVYLSEQLGEPYKIVLVGLSAGQCKSLPPEILGIEKTADITELAEIYSAADAVLNLSYCENYPTVNMEAQSCGTPVITYDTGGSAESVDTEYGRVIPRGDRDSVINAIRESEYKRLPESPRFDKNLFYSNYISLYAGAKQ